MQEKVFEEPRAGVFSAASETAILAAQAELWTKPGVNGKSNKQGLHVVPSSPLDIGSLIRDVEGILQSADKLQATLTAEYYIKAGQQLWALRDAHHENERRAAGIKRVRHETFDQYLAQAFPRRKRSTLREYMTLAKEFGAADEATKVQLVGHFKHGWGAVLCEIRRRKRLKRSQHRGSQPAIGDENAEDLRILLGDCTARLRELPDESVDCVITSPPYFRCQIFPGATTIFGGDLHCAHDWEKRQFTRRHYLNAPHTVESGTCRKCGAQLVMLGWEDTLPEYVQHMVEVGREIRRVLKPAGVFWLNVADTYLDKALAFVPHKLAFALLENGWICRAESIWEITNKAPESVIDRPYRNHEQLFMFIKQKDYSFDMAGMREPAVSKAGKETRFRRQVDFQGTSGTWQRALPSEVADGMRNRRSVWSIPNESFGAQHSCAFPKALVEPMLLSSCPDGGVCLDPFAGTGTTGLVALAHRRKAILIEASAEYCGIAKRRIDTELKSYKAELKKRLKQERGKRHLDA